MSSLGLTDLPLAPKKPLCGTQPDQPRDEWLPPLHCSSARPTHAAAEHTGGLHACSGNQHRLRLLHRDSFGWISSSATVRQARSLSLSTMERRQWCLWRPTHVRLSPSPPTHRDHLRRGVTDDLIRRCRHPSGHVGNQLGPAIFLLQFDSTTMSGEPVLSLAATAAPTPYQRWWSR